MPKPDPTVQMWAEALTVLERAEQLHRQFFRVRRDAAAQPVWEPPVDIVETQSAIYVLVAMPGAAPDRVSVTVDNQRVAVCGVRALPVPSGAAVIRRLEIPHGRFEREIELPMQRLELSQKELRNGCLLLTFTKLD